MWHAVNAGILAVVLATQATQTACPKDSPTTPETPQAPQTGEVFTTRDGVRFRVDVCVVVS